MLLFHSAIDRCVQLQEPNYLNLFVSVIILIGLFISYLPQHYRIVHLRTSEGISPYFILLGTTSATASFANILTLPLSRVDISCCAINTGFECFAGLLGIGQIGVQWVCFSVILLLFLIFFPRDPALAHSTPDKPSWRLALTIGFLCIVHGFIVLATSVLLVYIYPDYLSTWANILGVSAATLASLQYIPQIYTTYRLKHVGSLSIPMMCIQTPGGFVFAASLAARLGKEGWSTWGVYVVAACCQGVLLIMGIMYELQTKKRAGSTGGIYGSGHESSSDAGRSDRASESLVGARYGVGETDDEGSVFVEGDRRPLLGKTKKKSSRR